MFIAKCYGKIGRAIACLLVKTKITPNQITVTRFLITAPLCIYFFSRGEYIYNLLGLLSFAISGILDYTDGELARMKGQASSLGKWLDGTIDIIITIIILMSIMYGSFAASHNQLWILVAVVFFSGFYLDTYISAEYAHNFNLSLDNISRLRKDLKKTHQNLNIFDRLYLNVIDITSSSFAIICFGMCYPIVIGIILNQLLIIFIFIAIMKNLRFWILFAIYYRVLRKREDRSPVVKTLKEYLKDGSENR